MRPSLQTHFTFFMYRFHPSAYSPFRNPQSVSNFLVCPTCTFEFQRSIPTSLFPIWNANLSCAHDCILSCSPGDPINAALCKKGLSRYPCVFYCRTRPSLSKKPSIIKINLQELEVLMSL